MLELRLTSCKECSQVPNLLLKIDCKVFEMSNLLYGNLVYMLNTSFNSCEIETLLTYKRILENKLCNVEYAPQFTLEQIASRVNFLTAGCCTCDKNNRKGKITTTTTTTTASCFMEGEGLVLFVEDDVTTTTTTTTLL